MTALVWLRHDLRLHDNPALFNAAELGQGVVVVYSHCSAYVDMHKTAPVQLEFIRRHLQLLATDLAERNISLVVIRVAKPEQIAPELLRIALQVNAEYCFLMPNILLMN